MTNESEMTYGDKMHALGIQIGVSKFYREADKAIADCIDKIGSEGFTADKAVKILSDALWNTYQKIHAEAQEKLNS